MSIVSELPPHALGVQMQTRYRLHLGDSHGREGANGALVGAARTIGSGGSREVRDPAAVSIVGEVEHP